MESNRQAADNSRLAEICEIMDGLKNRPIPYDDKTVRQLIDCVIVLSNEQIKVILKGGLQVTQSLKWSNIIPRCTLGAAEIFNTKSAIFVPQTIVTNPEIC